MEVISYARASQDRAGLELSVERQLEDQRALADQRGWTLVAELKDNDVSAAGKRKRPGFEHALEMVRAGEAQMIVATDMTRLTRGKARDELRLLELGLETGLKLSFVRAPDLDLSTAAGRLTASILIAAARHEIEQKSERQVRAQRQAAEQGRWTGGRRRFGYEDDGKTIREAEAVVLREAYERIVAAGGTGVSLGAIARAWNTAGFFTPQTTRDGQPSPWRSQTVRSCLLNPAQAGLRARGKGRNREIVAVAEWPPIVPESTWRAAVAILADPARANPPRSGRALLTGLARCFCGSTVHTGASPARRGRPTSRTYRCRASQGHIGRRAEPIEEFVTAVVVERLNRPDARDLLVADDRPDVERLRAEVMALRTRRRALLALVADGTYTEDEARGRARSLAEDIARIEAQMVDAGRADALGPLIAAEDVQAAWNALDTERQRAVIDTLMRITIYPVGRGTRTFRPESVGIEWKT